MASLRNRGQRLDAPAEDDRFAEKEPPLAQLYAASISGTLVFPMTAIRAGFVCGNACAAASKSARFCPERPIMPIHHRPPIKSEDRARFP